MQTEFNLVIKNGTWDLTFLPAQRQAIDCRWVYKVKENHDGSINKHKAILMAKGFHQ